MNEAQALAEIIQTLTIDHGCHAVILYGSRARGDFQPASDWDVAGIRDATAPLRVARAFHGAWLDAFVYPEAAFTVIDPGLLRFLPARILVDQRGFAKTLLERVDLLNQQGPPPLPEGEEERVRVWYAKMLVRISRGDLESKYRRVELLYLALENYFKLRGLWYRGPKAALPWLAKHDPETHAAFAHAFESTRRWKICVHWFSTPSQRSNRKESNRTGLLRCGISTWWMSQIGHERSGRPNRAAGVMSASLRLRPSCCVAPGPPPSCQTRKN